MLCLAIVIVVAGCTKAFSGQPQPGIAVVAGETIDEDTFRDAYIDYLFKTGLADGPGHRKHVLNTLIAEHLLVKEARKTGIEETVAFIEAEKRHRQKLLIEAYVEKALFDTLQISEDELKDMFVRAKTTLTTRHLYARTRTEADRLHARLMAGTSFESLAKEVFADTALANNGGLVGSFTLDDMDPAFEDAAFTLTVGEISKPVRTATGYSIIKLEDRFVKPLITEYEYASRRDRMAHFVSYRKKTAARADHARALSEEMQPAFNTPAFDRLLGQIIGYAPISEEDQSAWMDEQLVTYIVDGESSVMDIATFRSLAATTGEAQRASVTDEESLKQFITGVLVREEMLRRAAAMQLDQLPAFSKVLDRANRSWIRDTAVSAHMSGVQVPADSVDAYFVAHDKEFNTPPALRIWEILLETRAQADEVRRALKKSSFERLASQHSLRPGADAAGGDLGYLSNEQLGVLSKHVQDALEGAVVGPVELKGYYVLLKIGDRRPGRPMRFEEAAPEIERRLKRSMGKQQVQQRIASLRQLYEVTIDHALLSALPLKSDT